MPLVIRNYADGYVKYPAFLACTLAVIDIPLSVCQKHSVHLDKKECRRRGKKIGCVVIGLCRGEILMWRFEF